MPALVKSRVGSSAGTTGDDGTNVWPYFFTKNWMNFLRISLAVHITSLRLRNDGRLGKKEDNHRPRLLGFHLLNQADGKGIAVMFPSVHRHCSQDAKDQPNDPNHRGDNEADSHKASEDGNDIANEQGELKV